MTNVLSTLVKCVRVKFLYFCACVLHCQPPILQFMYTFSIEVKQPHCEDICMVYMLYASRLSERDKMQRDPLPFICYRIRATSQYTSIRGAFFVTFALFDSL